MYTGIFMPDGSIPPGILNKKDRAQSAETAIDNMETVKMYMWRLMEIAISVFKWTGLPKGVDERMLEWWLLRDGFCGFFYDEDLKADNKRRAPEGYAVLPMRIGGQWDMYEYPTDRTAYSTNGLQVPCDETNSVLIFNNFLRVPMWLTLWQYAWRLAEAQRTVDINMRQQRTARVVVSDEADKLTWLQITKDADEGKPWILAYKGLDLNQLKVLDTAAPFIGNEVQIYKHQIWNEALTYLGVENVNTDKKERLVSDEVINNMGDVEASRFVRLNARKQACDEINELFGLNVDVEFRSGQYIRTGSTGNALVETDGMTDSGSEGGGNVE